MAHWICTKWACWCNQHLVRKQDTSHSPRASLLISKTAWSSLKQNSALQGLPWSSPRAVRCACVRHASLVGAQTLFMPVAASHLDSFRPMLREMPVVGFYNLHSWARKEVAANHPSTQTRVIRHETQPVLRWRQSRYRLQEYGHMNIILLIYLCIS